MLGWSLKAALPLRARNGNNIAPWARIWAGPQIEIKRLHKSLVSPTVAFVLCAKRRESIPVAAECAMTPSTDEKQRL